MKRRYREPEANLCAVMGRVLKAKGFEVGHSVRLDGVPGELDLCGYRVDEHGVDRTIAVQGKVTLNLHVFSQAIVWGEYSTFAAVVFEKWPQDDVGYANQALHRAAGIGLYRVASGGIVVTVLEPKEMSRSAEKVKRLAEAARHSSTGPLNAAGSRAPRVMRKPELEAERVATHMRERAIRAESLSNLAPDLTPDEIVGVVKVLNGKRGRALGLRAKTFGDDFLVYTR